MNKLRKYGIILTTIITIFTSSLIVTKAATPQIQVSQYHGQLFQYSYSTATGLPQRSALIYTIFINASETSTGTVTLNLSNTSSTYLNQIDQGTWYGEDCRITYNSSTHVLTVKMDHTDFCTVNCFLTGVADSALGGNLSWTITNNLTVDTDTTQSKLQEILNEFGDLNTYAETIKNDLHSLYLLIVDLTGDVQDINDHMTTVLTRMNTIITSISNVNTGITTIQNLINTNTQALATLLTAINSIDEQIDTISWIDETENYSLTWSNTINGTYNTTALSNKNDIYYKLTVNVQPTYSGDYIRKILLPAGFVNPGVNQYYDITVMNNYNVGNTYEMIEQPISYYSNRALRYFEIYLQSYIGTTSNNYMKYTIIHIHSDTPKLRTYDLTEFPLYVFKIGSNDIEYWQLLQTFNQWKYQKEQINATQELINLVSSLSSSTSNETTTNITNYNTNMEVINNIENNLSVDFGTYESGFKQQNENNWVIDEQLYQGANKFKTVFTNMLGYCDFEGTMLSLILLCAVLLAILG